MTSRPTHGESASSPKPRRVHTYGTGRAGQQIPSLEERMYLSAHLGVQPGERVSIYSYPIMQRDNPAPGHAAIPMTVEQRAAYLGWYGDFRNPRRISLPEFLQRHGISIPE